MEEKDNHIVCKEMIETLEKQLAAKDKEIESLSNSNEFLEMVIKELEKQKSEFAEFLKDIIKNSVLGGYAELKIKEKIAEMEKEKGK